MNLLSPPEQVEIVRHQAATVGGRVSARSDFRYHYLFGLVGSAMIALWAHFAVIVPNPDATLYLRAAEFFVQGDWHGGVSVYRWPFYSVLIAGAMWTTGLDALSAAQATNFLIDFGVVVAIINLARVLSRDNMEIVSSAAFFSVFHPQLTEFSSLIIRDHGYILFFLLSITLCIRDSIHQSLVNKSAILLSIVAATSFLPFLLR